MMVLTSEAVTIMLDVCDRTAFYLASVVVSCLAGVRHGTGSWHWLVALARSTGLLPMT